MVDEIGLRTTRRRIIGSEEEDREAWPDDQGKGRCCCCRTVELIGFVVAVLDAVALLRRRNARSVLAHELVELVADEFRL